MSRQPPESRPHDMGGDIGPASIRGSGVKPGGQRDHNAEPAGGFSEPMGYMAGRDDDWAVTAGSDEKAVAARTDEVPGNEDTFGRGGGGRPGRRFGTDLGVTPEHVAAEVFGFAELSPGQAGAVAALAGGRDCLVVMPSGAGKSAVCQIAAVARGCPAVVGSPLLSLQRDRARGLPAIPVNAGTRAAARNGARGLRRSAKPGFVYVAPEQLALDDAKRSPSTRPRCSRSTRRTASPPGP